MKLEVSGEVLFLLPLLVFCAIEGIDFALFSSSYFSLHRELGLSLSDIGKLSLCHAMAGSLFGPLWGLLSDQGVVLKKNMLVSACLIHGMSTVVLSQTTRFGTMLLLRAISGAVLSSLGSVSRAMAAEAVPDHRRGVVFGWLSLAAHLGGLLGALAPFSAQLAGVHWRLGFVAIGALSIVGGMAAFSCMAEPPRPRSAAASGGLHIVSLIQSMRRLQGYFCIPTFSVILIQGIACAMPWSAMAYLNLYFQVCGLTPKKAALLRIVMQVSSAPGSLVGGFVGDALTQRFGKHGRPLAAQISILNYIPGLILLFAVKPPFEDTFTYYLVLLVVMGLTATWTGSGVNAPILCDIVKADSRATVMALDAAFKGAFTCIFGNAMVGLLAQDVLGYVKADTAGQASPESQQALGRALLLTCAVPSVVCFCLFSVMHFTYPRDLLPEDEQQVLQFTNSRASEDGQRYSSTDQDLPKGKASFTRYGGIL